MSKDSSDFNEETLSPSIIPAPIVAFASIVPGLGQILAGFTRRGLIIFFSTITILGLMAWRFQLAAPRDTEVFDIVRKALRLEPALILITILFGILYIWNIVDAYRLAKTGRPASTGILLLIIVIFFFLGWQIGEINPVKLVTEADDAGPALSRVLWPWQRAIEYPETLSTVWAEVEVPCSDNPPPPTEPSPDQPYVVAEPTCGNLSEQGGEPGTLLTLTGRNLEPEVEASIVWEEPSSAKFRQRQEGEYVTVMPDENGAFEVDIIIPYRTVPPTALEGPMIWKVGAEQVVSVGSAQPSAELKLAIVLMVETIMIGMMATFFGVILAVPVSFFAAKNLMSANRFTLAVYYFVRFILNIIRAIEPVIWAIIFVIIVGLGPFAGILALTVHSVAALGKLYSESIESIDPGPIEAIHATGANWTQTVIYAVLPQVIPPFVSFTIYRWDINIRMSTIIGLVGGGGIGFLLIQYIRLLDYRAAGICVWFIAITVAILDYVSAEIRERFV